MRQRIVAVVTRPEFWLLGLLCWLLLSAGRSLGTPWARVALTEALRWSAGIGLALVLGAFFRHTKAAARFVVTLAGAIALLGIADGLRPGSGGLTGPYQDHQLYGSVLLLFLPPVVAVALTARSGRWRLGGVAAAGLGALCLALSQTRSAWAGALAATLVFGGLWLLRSRRRRRDGRSTLVGATALTGAVLVLWLLLAPPDLRAPMATRVGTLSHLSVDESWQSRITVWRGASRLVAAHPLCGIGLGRYPGAQWAWTRAGHPLEPSERPSLSEEAHDFYLQTATETGLIGLGLYAMALAAFVFQGLRRLRQTRRRRSSTQTTLVIASLSLVAGQAVDALASPSWQFGEASLLFWALLGLGMAAMRGEEPETIPVRMPVSVRRVGRFALSGGVTVALAANVLPLGLLTPVEAYTAPAGWTYVAGTTTVTPLTQSGAQGQTVYITLTAQFKDGSGGLHTVNVSNDSTASYNAVIAPTGMTAVGQFTKGAATYSSADKVAFTIPSDATYSNKTLNINGSFKVGAVTYYASPQATLTISN